MVYKTSVSHTEQRRNHARPIRLAAAFAVLAAVVVLAGASLTFVYANQMMRGEAKPLDVFSSNILPDFTLASFSDLDEQTRLAGWFFPADQPVSTIIIVHDQGKNRLQFDLDSAYLFRDLVALHFNVLAFDLRASGESGGQMSGFGYAEWADVLAAVSYVRKFSTTKDVVLYGFGSGVTACLLAVHQLPPPGERSGYSDRILKLGVDQSYIRGLILDTPCQSADDYIKASCRQDGWLKSHFLQYTVPYAIRLSNGSPMTNLASLLTRIQSPVFLTYGAQDTFVGTAAIKPLVQERMRLHPDTTQVFVAEHANYTGGYLKDQDQYLASLHEFLTRYIVNHD